MEKKQLKKLHLKKSTIRRLTSSELTRVVGGTSSDPSMSTINYTTFPPTGLNDDGGGSFDGGSFNAGVGYVQVQIQPDGGSGSSVNYSG